jgi:hypothetical protein
MLESVGTRQTSGVSKTSPIAPRIDINLFQKFLDNTDVGSRKACYLVEHSSPCKSPRAPPSARVDEAPD